jgi:3',5'-cyclic AMP phosphodiesterase CpdA
MAFLAHLSDLHVGSMDFREELIFKAVDDINSMGPNATIVTGDLTENGYLPEFLDAKMYLEQIKSPLMVVPGNHDARHVGDETFQELFKEKYSTLNVEKNGLRVVGLDSSEPDLDYGKIGRAQQKKIENELADAKEKGLYKIIALHHHIIPVPRTGRERNVLSDAGDILLSLVDHNADLVLSGHKHIPHVWMVQGTAFSTAGTVSSLKLRGKELSSFNTVHIEEEHIDIVLNRSDGETRSLAKYERTCR